MEQIRVYNILSKRDGTIAFIEFKDGDRSKILSKKNFEKRFEIDLESFLIS